MSGPRRIDVSLPSGEWERGPAPRWENAGKDDQRAMRLLELLNKVESAPISKVRTLEREHARLREDHAALREQVQRHEELIRRLIPAEPKELPLTPLERWLEMNSGWVNANRGKHFAFRADTGVLGTADSINGLYDLLGAQAENPDIEFGLIPEASF